MEVAFDWAWRLASDAVAVSAAVYGWWLAVMALAGYALTVMASRLGASEAWSDTAGGFVTYAVIAAVALAWVLPAGVGERARRASERSVAAAAPHIGEAITARGERLHVLRRPIGRATFGADWPLTVDTAVLGCVRRYGGGGQVLVAGGKAWSVNGLSKEMAGTVGLHIEIDGRAVPVRPWNIDDAEVARLWAFSGGRFQGMAMRFDWSVMIKAAAALGCSSIEEWLRATHDALR